MKQFLLDSVGLGVLFWVISYILVLILFSTPLSGIMGWLLFVFTTPLIAWWTYDYFLHLPPRPLPYFLIIAVVWTAIAVLLDLLFIILLFQPEEYYQAEVFAYYAETFLIPVGVGWYLQKHWPGLVPPKKGI